MPDNKIKIDDEIHGFKLLKIEDIPEIKYTGNIDDSGTHNAYEYVHLSGAKLLHLENEDPELSFAIGFKTLPKDSTGVFHILEHSVLCGSKKYPVKEPFTNLLKSSMQTFLNAMTYPDKTIYPVASTNEKDFYNLVNVYMDAVLYPNIYKNKNIFYQEGGHKTLEGFSGVVFNEMSGVYSDPQEHIFEGLMQQLFPGSCYSYSSGGSPEVIKQLTYEEYLAQHNTNYCLSNAYIIVYGKLNIEKMFKFLNDNYLSCEDELKDWRGLTPKITQGCFENNYNYETGHLPYKKEVQTAKENAECGAGYVLERNHKKLAATRVLLNAIASSNESPLKKALLDEAFCADIDFDMLAEIYEPFIIVECKSSKENASENLLQLISEKVKQITDKGISKKLLVAALSNIEFKLKEKNPDCTTGIDSSLAAMTEWLYDDDASTSAIKYLDDIKWLKEQIKTDYFDKLANEIFVDNKHVAVVEVVPVDNIKTDKPNYSVEEKQEIAELCENLEKWQTTPDTKENEAKIPVMNKSDIEDINEFPKPKIYKKNDTLDIINHSISDAGITHLNRYYSLDCIKVDDLAYASILTLLLGKLRTKNYTSEDLHTFTQNKLGNFDIKLVFYENRNDPNIVTPKLCVKSSALTENEDYLLSLVDEIIYNTQFDDYEKIKTILLQQKVGLEQVYIMSGHLSAINTALSGILPSGYYKNLTSGIDYYKFLKNLIQNFDNERKVLIEKLGDIYNVIFKSHLTLSVSGSSVNEKFESKADNELIKEKKNTWNSSKTEIPNVNKLAVIIPTDVNYCAEVFDARLNNSKVSGTDICTSKIISLDYLWNEVRVKNGAYGAGMLASMQGTYKYYSYRDPKTDTTFANFENSAKWLRDKNLTQRELDNYIISCVAKIDAPLPSRIIIDYLDNCHFSNIEFNSRKISRNEVINTNLDDVKEDCEKISLLLKSANKCIFGGKDIEKLKSDGFISINLFDD